MRKTEIEASGFGLGALWKYTNRWKTCVPATPTPTLSDSQFSKSWDVMVYDYFTDSKRLKEVETLSKVSIPLSAIDRIQYQPSIPQQRRLHIFFSLKSSLECYSKPKDGKWQMASHKVLTSKWF